MPRFKLTALALLCLLAFAVNAARAATPGPAPGDKDLKKAEAVLSKLLRLEESAAARGSDAFDGVAKKIYPGLFVAVAELRDDGLKTELATAASFYEAVYRTRGDASAPDCSRELRQSYFRLCRESGDRAGLLRAKAALHTRRAVVALRYARGERDAATLDALAEIRAERSTDLALAEETLRALKELADEVSAPVAVADAASDSFAAAGGRVATRAAATSRPYENLSPSLEELSSSLEEVDRLLASLPRTHVRQLLGNARDAFRDGLFWQLKTLPSRALVVSAQSFADPNPLLRFNLDAEDASRAALQNLRAAQKFIGKAEAVIEESKRGASSGE
ncbi:MAG TPA: hypothetical protein VHU19_07900 [Pyrinomonadaceae bacterium]|jgi:hypothetical protein|nr:hypothetical protein [Pyrinomonadaceae bacterium]